MPRALVLAARQPEFSSLLEASGFDVEVRTRPLDDRVDADVAVVFRGRLIGRNQAAVLSAAGIPVVEVLTASDKAALHGDHVSLPPQSVALVRVGA